MVFLYTLFTISLFGMHHDNFISQSTTTAVDVHGCDVAAAVPSPPAVKSGSQQGALDSRGEGSEAKHTSLRSSIHHEEDVLSGAAKLCAKGQNSYSFSRKVRFRLRITLSTLNYKVVYLREIFCPQNGDNREPCFIVSFWDFVSLAIVFTLCLRETKVFMFYACNFPHDVSNMLKLSPALWICHITSSSNLTSEEFFFCSHPPTLGG